MNGIVSFRRLLIDRPRQRLVAEIGPWRFVQLSGTYNPDAVLDRVKRSGVINLDHWEEWWPEGQ